MKCVRSAMVSAGTGSAMFDMSTIDSSAFGRGENDMADVLRMATRNLRVGMGRQFRLGSG